MKREACIILKLFSIGRKFEPQYILIESTSISIRMKFIRILRPESLNFKNDLRITQGSSLIQIDFCTINTVFITLLHFISLYDELRCQQKSEYIPFIPSETTPLAFKNNFKII